MPSWVKEVIFDAVFERSFKNYTKRLPAEELDGLKERLIIFRNNPFNPKLKTHKLKGRLKEYWAFSISYSDRILFRFLDKGRVFFIDIGDHSIYE